MIRIGLDPLLVTLGAFSISWHSLFTLIDIVVGVWLPVRFWEGELASWGGILGRTITGMIFAQS